jgi:transposase InsO family protein
MAVAVGAKPDRLLLPKCPNHVWHLDLTSLRVLWFHFTAAAILDGFSRKLLCVKVYIRTPGQLDVIKLVRTATNEFGKPKFLITDHGTQFRSRFHAAMRQAEIRHVKGRVRAPYLNGKLERATWHRQWQNRSSSILRSTFNSLFLLSTQREWP